MTNLPAFAAASSAAAAAYGAYTTPAPAAMLMTAEQLSSSYGLTPTSSTAPSAVSSPCTSSKTRVETTLSSAHTVGAIEVIIETGLVKRTINPCSHYCCQLQCLISVAYRFSLDTGAIYREFAFFHFSLPLPFASFSLAPLHFTFALCTFTESF